VKLSDLFVVALLIVFIALGAYAIWLVASPQQEINYGTYTAQRNETYSPSAVQFYPKMRFSERNISYFIEDMCSQKKEQEIHDAFSIISQKTILTFYQSSINPRIKFMCSQMAPPSGQEGSLVAGEGGPVDIVNTTNYFVILQSEVSLFRTDNCPVPQIALHEIFHALGFDHNNLTTSIMYPVTSCVQVIDKNITDEINKLYSTKAAPDLVMEEVGAKQVGRYVNFEANVSNMGLIDILNANLEVYDAGGIKGNYSLQEVDIGSKKVLNVYNLKVSTGTKELLFRVVPVIPNSDFNMNNNEATISIAA